MRTSINIKIWILIAIYSEDGILSDVPKLRVLVLPQLQSEEQLLCADGECRRDEPFHVKMPSTEYIAINIQIFMLIDVLI